MLVIMKESLKKLKRDTVLFYTFPAQPVLPTRAAQLFHFSDWLTQEKLKRSSIFLPLFVQ